MTNEEKITKEHRDKKGIDKDREIFLSLLQKPDTNKRSSTIVIGEENDPVCEISNHQQSEIPPTNNNAFNVCSESQNLTTGSGKFKTNKMGIRRDHGVMYLLPYVIVFLFFMVTLEITDYFSDREPKGYIQKIFYPKQYWQKRIKSLEKNKQSIEALLAINETDLAIIRSSRNLNIEKSISYAKSLGMDTHQARLDAEKQINEQIRKIGLVNQSNKKELDMITDQIESAKRKLDSCK